MPSYQYLMFTINNDQKYTSQMQCVNLSNVFVLLYIRVMIVLEIHSEESEIFNNLVKKIHKMAAIFSKENNC